MKLLAFQCILAALLLLSCEHMVVEAKLDMKLTAASATASGGYVTFTVNYTGSDPVDTPFWYTVWRTTRTESTATASSSPGSASLTMPISPWSGRYTTVYLKIGSFLEHFYEMSFSYHVRHTPELHRELSISPLTVTPAIDLPYQPGASQVSATLTVAEGEFVQFVGEYEEPWPFRKDGVKWIRWADDEFYTSDNKLISVVPSQTFRFDTDLVKSGYFTAQASRLLYDYTAIVTRVYEYVVFNVHEARIVGPFERIFVEMLNKDNENIEGTVVTTIEGQYNPAGNLKCRATGSHVTSLVLQYQNETDPTKPWVLVETAPMYSAEYTTLRYVNIRPVTPDISGKYRCVVNGDQFYSKVMNFIVLTRN